MRRAIILLTLSIPLHSFSLKAQDSNRQYTNHYSTIGINIGTAALNGLIAESGINIEYYYQKEMNKYIFLGIDQGLIIQNNFPSNYYSTNTAPFHLAPIVDGYIRSLTWDEAFNFEWTKSTLVSATPFIGTHLLHYKQISLNIRLGVGVQYRNYTRFGLVNFVTDKNGLIVDYRERITTNSVVAPILNFAVGLSQNLTSSLSLGLTFKYNYELSNPSVLENSGPAGDYMALQLGLSKKF